MAIAGASASRRASTAVGATDRDAETAGDEVAASSAHATEADHAAPMPRHGGGGGGSGSDDDARCDDARAFFERSLEDGYDYGEVRVIDDEGDRVGTAHAERGGSRKRPRKDTVTGKGKKRKSAGEPALASYATMPPEKVRELCLQRRRKQRGEAGPSTAKADAPSAEVADGPSKAKVKAKGKAKGKAKVTAKPKGKKGKGAAPSPS